MKWLAAFLVFFTTACTSWVKEIDGNGNLITQNRTIEGFDAVKIAGDVQVELMQGPVFSVNVQADDNLQDYILTQKKGHALIIKYKKNVQLNTKNPLKVIITLPALKEVNIAGSGQVTATNTFTSVNTIKAAVGGSGTIHMEVNTPSIEAVIGGSGKIVLQGKTKNIEVNIGGSGHLLAQDLLAENVVVSIGGSGTARVFAEVNLKAKIGGSGSVFYKGNASVETSIGGSGVVQKTE
jgi:hypothetical protein